MTQADAVHSSDTEEPLTPLLMRLSSKLVPELKRYVKLHRQEVQEMIGAFGPGSGVAASHRYTRVIDGLISALFFAATTAMSREKPVPVVALGAVGSYGRGSLSMFSDLDVRLLCAAAPEAASSVVEALLYPLWDAGLSIGHQVVTADDVLELARSDLPTATSLLDWRHLVGEAPLTEAFQRRAFEEVFVIDHLRQFIALLADAAHERKERFGGSVFLLEPDLKNGAGGLRDLDVAHWAARARWRVRSLSELVSVGVLVPDEWAEIEQSINFIVRVRNGLHVRGGRRVDRLTFEDQEYLAEALGYGKGGRGVESFMSEFYRQARAIELASEMILRRAMPPPKTKPVEISLGNGFKQIGRTIGFEDDDALYGEPWLAFAIFEEAIERQLAVSDASCRVLMRAVGTQSFCEQLRLDRLAALSFRRLVVESRETPFKYGSVLTQLHELGLLLAIVPEFAPVVGRVHHDVYHVYTVDVHSIAAVDKLRAVFRGALEDALPLATRLAKESRRPEVLFFAALLHDIGKDAGGRRHAERGAELSTSILQRLHFEPHDIEAIAHLILQHLKMYLVATRRDIDDPRTLEDFARHVVQPEGLLELYLLTICDVSTTSPTALNSWKLRMLDELYHAAQTWLLQGQTRRSERTAIEQQVRQLLPSELPSALVHAFLQSMPERYLGANNSEWVVKHLELAHAARGQTASVSVLRQGTPHVEIAVVADDHPGLLAQICAAFSERKFKVVGAQVYSWVDDRGRKRALDLFWVRAGLEPKCVLDSVGRLGQVIDDIQTGKVDPLELIGANPDSGRYHNRPSPPVPIQVRIDNHEASRHTIVEVITKDRPDLLFWISETIYECGLSIDLAKIHTEGVRVTDVFYVCTRQGEKLTDAHGIDELKRRLGARLRQLENKQ